MKLIHNFTITEDYSPAADWQNRAFQYGDGLFETIILRGGKVRFLSDHYQRLQSGLAALKMTLPEAFSLVYLETCIPELARLNALSEAARVKIHVWRKPGGLYTPVTREAEFILTTSSLREDWFSVKGTVAVFDAIRRVHSSISAYKTCSALPYVLAGLAREEAAADDVILLDTAGNMAECLAANLFWWYPETQQLATPTLRTGCIDGVMRTQIIRRAAQLGIEVIEVSIPVSELRTAEVVFTCNVAGIQFIRQVQDMTFRTENIPEPVWELLKMLR